MPRGKRYANNGSVVKISLQGNKIYAKVQGTRSTPYNITIGIPKFPTRQKQDLMSAIWDNPLILARLLNRELPQELHRIAANKNINIFPSSWKDLDMECSCPDWAVPCKHLAAVIYMIANEIDRNPFNIFLLHGLDILDELRKNGLHPDDTKINIPSLQERLSYEEKQNKPSSDDPVPALENLDFSIIPKLNETLLSMLDDQTLFYNADLKKRMDTAYRKISKEVKNEQKDPRSKEDTVENYEQYSSVKIVISDKSIFGEAVLHGDIEQHEEKRYSIQELIIFWGNIPPKRVNHLPRSLLALYMIYKFAVKLLVQGAFIPELLEIPGKKYAIRWLPASVNEEVKSIADTLSLLIPAKTVYMSDAGGEGKYFGKDEQLKTVASLFLNYFVHISSLQFVKPAEPVEKLFFSGAALKFNEFGEMEIPQTIHRWLSKFYIHHKSHVPVIRVQEGDDEFIVDVLVENRSDAYQEPVQLKDFLEKEEYRNVKTGLLKDLTLLTFSFVEFQDIIRTSGQQVLQFNPAEFKEVLLRILPLIKMYRIKVLLPNALKNIARPQTSLSLSKKSEDKGGRSFLSLDKLLDFNWQVALGNTAISPDEFLEMVGNMSGIVKIRNQYVIIDQKDIKKLSQNLEEPPSLKAGELIQTVLTGEYRGAKISITPEAKKMIRSYLDVEYVELPEGLDAKLRPYQLRGYEWMYKNVNMEIGSIIADDMGLGKTLQVIAVLLKLKEEGRLDKHKVLAIVPTTLLSNWEKEIGKFAPGMDTFIYHGPGRKLELDHDIVITTYGIARSDKEILQKVKWQCQIIDESQNIKNPSAG